MKTQKQIFKLLKRISIVLAMLVVLLGVASYFTQKWLEYNLVDIMNEDESRAYDITYESLDLSPSFKGIRLEEVCIQPKNKYQGTIINCKINRVKVEGLHWRDLVIRGQANIKEISFVSPDFDLTLAATDTSKSAASREVQQFFGDVLSRVSLNTFRIEDGSFILYKQEEQRVEKGHVGSINFEAKDIETDSLQWKSIIPFKVGEVSSVVEDILFYLDEHSTISCASLKYDPKHSSITFADMSLKLNKSKKEMSEIIGKQSDIFEFDLNSLSIIGLDANSDLYGAVNISSKSLIIDGLVLKDYKNKNQPAIDVIEKPMFSKMIAAIPFDLNVDTILIKNTTVQYTEVSKGKSTGGTIQFNYLNGSIYGFTTLDSLQIINKSFDLKMTGTVNSNGKLKVNFNIPYAKDEFHLKAKLEDFDMQCLNKTIKPMLGIIVESGDISMLRFDMWANNRRSNNKMILHYTDLKLSILEDNTHYNKKRGFVSGLANSLMRESNQPDDKNYRIAKYSTIRNIYRAPFNLVWFSVQDGLKEIIPSKMAQGLMNREKSSDKSSKSNSKKNRKEE